MAFVAVQVPNVLMCEDGGDHGFSAPILKLHGRKSVQTRQGSAQRAEVRGIVW